MFGQTLRTLPPPAKWLATAYLIAIAIGYVYAVGNVALVVGLSREAIIKHYYGDVTPSARSAPAVRPARSAAPVASKASGAAPARTAAREEEFTLDEPAPTPSGAARRARAAVLDEAAELKEASAAAPAIAAARPSFKNLVTQGHFHSLGMSSFFLGVCIIALFLRLPERLKIAIVVLPFVSIVLDNASFLLTRFLGPAFSWLVVLSGGLMALSFTVILFLSLYQLWFWKPKSEVAYA